MHRQGVPYPASYVRMYGFRVHRLFRLTVHVGKSFIAPTKTSRVHCLFNTRTSTNHLSSHFKINKKTHRTIFMFFYI